MERFKIPLWQFREAIKNMEGQELRNFLGRFAFDDDGAIPARAAPQLDTQPFPLTPPTSFDDSDPRFKQKQSEEERVLGVFVKLETDPIIVEWLRTMGICDDDEEGRFLCMAALAYVYKVGQCDLIQERGVKQ